MLLEELLNDFPRERFLREHYQKRPYSGRAAAERLFELGSWSTVDELVERTECDMLLARQGVPYTGERPRTAKQARELFAQGYTLVLRQPDQHHAGLSQLARTFSAELHGRINLHLYCTPAAQHGFGWHCDPEEVFILQTAGRTVSWPPGACAALAAAEARLAAPHGRRLRHSTVHFVPSAVICRTTSGAPRVAEITFMSR